MAKTIHQVYKENISKLSEAFPVLFNKADPLPLALNAFEQLNRLEAHHGLTKTQLRKCLRVWCNRYEYHRALRKDGSIRFNANLTEAEPVSQEHRDHAARAHDKIRHDYKARKKLKNNH